MKSSVEHLESTKVKVDIEVPFEEFKPEIDKASKSISKQVNLPGFRPGHVPTRVLEAQFGRPAIIEEALNGSMDKYFQQAAQDLDLHPLGQPMVDVTDLPLDRGATTPIKFTVTVSARPIIVLPDPASITLDLENVDVSDEDVDARLQTLLARFGTLKDVDRAVKKGDYAVIDLSAKIDDEEVDSLSEYSFHVGDADMIDGLDETLEGMSAGDSDTFQAPLAGGLHAGEQAQITVTVQKVKEQELPEADDEFAQMASEFDTIDELREDLRTQVGKDKATNRVNGARDLLLEKLREAVSIDVPQDLVDQQVNERIQSEGAADDEDRKEAIKKETADLLADQFLLDEYAEAFNTEVDQPDLLQFMFQQAQMYGIDPNEFINAAVQTDQVNNFAFELRRGKALVAALRLAKLQDADGNAIDATEVLGEKPEKEIVPDFAELAQKRQETLEQAEKEIAEHKKAAEDAAAAAQANADAAADEAGNAEEGSSSVEPSQAEDAGESGEKSDFDPANAKVDEVLAYLADADEAERARVIAAEKAGKARKTILSAYAD
ncbi:MAG: trigger factor [Actinomycetaceae bacterium]|nr:trigger factor [Actinomycetaceae bacterium]MDY6082940.1 trigger factor [Actinomycetaceae bacterium]